MRALHSRYSSSTPGRFGDNCCGNKRDEKFPDVREAKAFHGECGGSVQARDMGLAAIAQCRAWVLCRQPLAATE